MAARAIVTRYGNERVPDNNNFVLEAYFLLTDPATFPQQLGQHGVVTVELDAANPGTWSASIETAVIAYGAALPSPFALLAANVFIPTPAGLQPTPTFIPPTEEWLIPQYSQALYNITIDAEGVIDGDGVFVEGD